MLYRWLSVLSMLSAVLLVDPVTPPAPLWGDIRVKHTWNTVPANWESLGPPPAGTTIDIHIALKSHRENALIDALHEVSNPMHQKYGAHLSKEQVSELVAPHRDTLEIVHSWLEHHGVPSSSISTSHGGGWLTITGMPVSQADELLSASYQVYRHTGTNETEAILRTVGYALPVVLHAHVQTVAPTTHFASLRTPLRTPPRRSSGEAEVVANATSEVVRTLSRRVDVPDPQVTDMVTPSYLRWLYNVETYSPLAAHRNRIAILGFQTGYPSHTDLILFLADYRMDAMTPDFDVVLINGGRFDQINIGSEASAGIQYTEAIAYPTPHIFYSTGGLLQSSFNGEPAPDDAYLKWFHYLLAQPDIPQTISVPYAHPEQEFPQEYARALCNLFAQLGARGVSVVVSSGNEGVGSGDCADRFGNVKFIPMFPASCPWVTSVGGTTHHDPETGADFSGGGFSHYFPRPKYQDEAMPNYLDYIGIEYHGYYNPMNRGIPDISAQARQYLYVQGATASFISGTTCSTATIVGIVSLLNDYQLSIGKPPLGFLNPWLYGYGSLGFTDIKYGSNPGCNTLGFPAIEGWDPVTGLGTPDFAKLLPKLFVQDDDLFAFRGGHQNAIGILGFQTGLGFTDFTFGSSPGYNTPGFPAVAGWDPVTGLGTLDFERMWLTLSIPRSSINSLGVMIVW